ncbi:MAG: aminopeptidase N [Burkholderiaceae bacterium]|nr:MAG: aminopeptidase N [Burkholderiaceae bacterium]
MRTDQAVTIHRNDYMPSACRIDHVDLHFTLAPQATRVRCTLTGRRDDASTTPLILDGEDLSLCSVALNGTPLTANQYRLDEKQLVVPFDGDRFTLETEVTLDPAANTQLMGLYQSNGNYFTQCEAEGFRRITFFPDRPDVMARYRVTLVAPQASCPVLLSNGNLIAQGKSDDGQHWAQWEDPFPKPCYLFALVAGTLVCEEKKITTQDGSEKLLQVWVEEKDRSKTSHAMNSLVRAIQWDERRFGLPLDLERFMIVAVSDFNMGAMENKGLNIFNTKYVLADPDSATDTDYANIESVVGHEYFHNWSGNRVTCRDWFQLSLKEGLTVFRDQEFSMDVASSYGANPAARAVCRIADVRTLRNLQFPEDAGPMAHPIRPDSYQEINNFYTMTVYEKGAEVVRMLQTLLGRDGFRKGMNLYFQRHDGHAVTCDDFVAAMADANGADLTQFAHWYSQAGTPRISARGQYDAEQQRYTLTLRQSCPATPGQPDKQPFHIPIAVGLLDLATGHNHPTRILELKQPEQSFHFDGIATAPIPSLLRDFSAPVILQYDYSDDDLAFLMRSDADPFNRWEAGQRLATRRILAQRPVAADDAFVQACQTLLTDESFDPAFKELMLTLPSEAYLAEQVVIVDAVALHQAREHLRRTLAEHLKAAWLDNYHAMQTPGSYTPDPLSAGKRALKNLALNYLLALNKNSFAQLAQQQYQHADNMTDRYAALATLTHSAAPERTQVLQDFAQRYAGDALVMDKWFGVQATRIPVEGLPPVLDDVRRLLQHPAFSLKNPNKVRSLISAFCHSNPAQFHAADGSGYAFWAEHVLALDSINPQVAARLARALDRWRVHIPRQRALMQLALERVQKSAQSNDVREVIEKALNE